MDTYAPVVHWSTVRLIIIPTYIHDLKTQSFDLSNAFYQSKIPKYKLVYIKIPTGFDLVNV